MDNVNFTAGREGLDFASSVEALIKDSCIVDYGIIQKVTSKGLVEVSLAVSQTEQSMVIMTCVLANIASSSFTLDVIPNVGDRVLVVYPRIYDEDMFDVPDSDSDKTKIIVNKRAKGYNLATGIAILLNQCKTACHKNAVKIEKGTVDLKLAYDKNNDKNKIVFTSNADGEIAFNSNDKVDITVNKDGETELKSNKNIDIKIDKDGAMTIKNKAEIQIDKNGNVTINAKSGKVSIKNTRASLYTILNGMLNILNTSLSTAGSPASHTVVPSQFSAQATQLGQLMQ